MEKFMALPLDKVLKNRIKSFNLPEPLGFGKVPCPIMAACHFKGGKWTDVELTAYAPLEIDPSAKVLHYGQQIFEGMKSYKNGDRNPILFRPELNFKRFNTSALRMAMPEVPEEHFQQAVANMVHYLTPCIPVGEGESLYIRPFMFATQPGLGLASSEEYTFLVIASPSGAYFSADRVAVLVERQDCRAAPGGTGNVKVAGNYGGSIKSALKARDLGYHQTLWLDAATRQNIEELSGMNFFAVIAGELYTPKLTDSLLPGITRTSLIDLARDFGLKVHEKSMDIDHLIADIKSQRCTEVFACGTAAVLTPITELGEADGTRYVLKEPYGPVSQKLRDALTQIQGQALEDKFGWIKEVPGWYESSPELRA